MFLFSAIAELSDERLIGRLHQADHSFALAIASQCLALLLLWVAKKWLGRPATMLPRFLAVSLLLCSATALATWQAAEVFRIRALTETESPLRLAAQVQMQNGLQLIGLSSSLLVILAWIWLRPAVQVKR
jgi:hypothetical protein